MTEPMFDQVFEDNIWQRLPEVYRRVDALQFPAWPLKSFLAALSQAYVDVTRLIDRFMYVAPNDRGLRHVTPGPSGAVYASNFATMTPDPNDGVIWDTGDVAGDTFFILTDHADQAFVRYSPYLEGGTYSLVFDYLSHSDNGIATVSVENVDIATITLDDSGSGFGSGDGFLTGDFDPGLEFGGYETGDFVPPEAADGYDTGDFVSALADTGFLTTADVTFTVERGYANIKIRYDEDLQVDNTKRINVGAITITNLITGYQFGTSDLVNPNAADPEWLPWLALLFGIKLDQSLPIDAQREQILQGYTGYNAGTKDAIAATVRPFLTGTRQVRVYDHSTLTIGAGGEFDVLIVTRGSETPAGFDPVAAVIAAGAKPAGVVLRAKTYTATWDAILAVSPHWQDWEAETWLQLSESGL